MTHNIFKKKNVCNKPSDKIYVCVLENCIIVFFEFFKTKQNWDKSGKFFKFHTRNDCTNV